MLFARGEAGGRETLLNGLLDSLRSPTTQQKRPQDRIVSQDGCRYQGHRFRPRLSCAGEEIYRQSHEWLSVRDFRRLAYVTAKHCERQLASDSQEDGTRVGWLSHISPIP